MSSKKDLTGLHFGRLTVLEYAYSKNGRAYWKCICECGKETVALGKTLLNGGTKSCGCLRAELNREKFLKDLTGKTFGRLTVIKYTRTNKRKEAIWLCKCTCGNTCEVSGACLLCGHTRSCGCLHRETSSENIKKAHENPYKKHGCRHERLYSIWKGMKYRCNNPSSESYKYYGAKGVKVCEEWQAEYLPFREWAMANGYEDNLTIDRINPFGNYEPSNCRWVTMQEQGRNKRSNYKQM